MADREVLYLWPTWKSLSHRKGLSKIDEKQDETDLLSREQQRWYSYLYLFLCSNMRGNHPKTIELQGGIPRPGCNAMPQRTMLLGERFNHQKIEYRYIESWLCEEWIPFWIFWRMYYNVLTSRTSRILDLSEHGPMDGGFFCIQVWCILYGHLFSRDNDDELFWDKSKNLEVCWFSGVRLWPALGTVPVRMGLFFAPFKTRQFFKIKSASDEIHL